MKCAGMVGKILLAILAPWTSKRLWMVIIGLAFVNSLFWAGVYYLYSFQEQWRAEIFFKMFMMAMATCDTMVLGYLGFQTFGKDALTNASSAVQTIMEKSK